MSKHENPTLVSDTRPGTVSDTKLRRNVFHTFTRRSLKANKTRTLVTIIGIVLSMALFTAVIEGAYSGIEYMKRNVIAQEGSWNALMYNLTDDQVEELKACPEVDQVDTIGELGWAEIPSENPDKPYLLVQAINPDSKGLYRIHMLNGRLPETPDEIVLPVHLSSNGNHAITLGDTISLDIGARQYLDGTTPLDRSIDYISGDEKITAATTHTYTIVGICERPDYDLEPYACPGYSAFTASAVVSDTNGGLTFLTLKDPADTYDFMQEQRISDNFWTTHSELLYFYGTTKSANLNSVIYGFAVILILLIAFGSISLIYNSFSISVSERTKLFGILKSVGATKRQIRSSVLYEALLLSLIGIPVGLIVGCAGIGITLYCLRDAFSGIFYTGSSGNVPMKLVLNWAPLLIACLVCLVTTLISAWIPARKAIRISPIDAIRQTTDVKIKSRSVRTSKLTLKLFGFEGMMASKNFKRNKKRYRSVVISLFLSVTLFISASSFCSYLKDTVAGVTGSSAQGADITYYTVSNEYDPQEILQLLGDVPGASKGVYAAEETMEMQYPEEFIDDSVYDFPADYTPENGTLNFWTRLLFLQDDYFTTICQENGLDVTQFTNPDKPLALFFGHLNLGYYGDNGLKFYPVEVVKDGVSTFTCSYPIVRTLDGFVYYYSIDDQYYYFPDAYLEAYYQSDETEPDPTQALILSEEEAMDQVTFTIGAELSDQLYFLRDYDCAIIYPYSMKAAVLRDYAEDTLALETDYYFMADDHKAVYNDMATTLVAANMEVSRLYDGAASTEVYRMLITIINVFSYGFIILISLIAMANVFNTISTNISLRRREIAMLRSIGMSQRGFSKMMNYECFIYGLKGLLWGLPASFLMTYGIYLSAGVGYSTSFYIPWYSITIAVLSVFLVVFATMRYSAGKIRKDNTIDALKNENL